MSANHKNNSKTIAGAGGSVGQQQQVVNNGGRSRRREILLERQLSDTRRELELNRQLTDQLDRIRRSQQRLQLVTSRLVYDIADLDDQQLEQLHNQERSTMAELRQLDRRLEMLQQIQNNECDLRVKMLSYKRSPKNQRALVIDNKEVFIDTGADADVDDDVVDNEDDNNNSDNEDKQSKSGSIGTDGSGSVYSTGSGRAFGRKRQHEYQRIGRLKRWTYYLVLAIIVVIISILIANYFIDTHKWDINFHIFDR
ncbi:uncharacterized protein LOC128953910 [Oppia nitens]|uniref:uncharacterized protein LOC128953910 n=1 Tax=Oppia nitens TaxID=1686743 RepID=UPI0023DA3FFE|nr:uncharacterized protein LOC128953910 [Oppia nitens]